MCPTNDGLEDVKHFLLLCPSFEFQQRDLLAGVSTLLRSFVIFPNRHPSKQPFNRILEYLPYGDEDLTDDVNRSY